jgi:hypothetical protein
MSSGFYVDMRDAKTRYVIGSLSDALHDQEKSLEELTTDDVVALFPALLKRVAELEENKMDWPSR